MKANTIIETMEQFDAKFLSTSSVWNVYNANIGKSKSSNVYQDAMQFIKKGKKVVAVIGAKGRTQHSKTEVLLFDATIMRAPDSYYFNIYEIKE